MLNFGSPHDKLAYARDAFGKIRSEIRKARNQSRLIAIERVCAWELKVINEVSEVGYLELMDLFEAKRQELAR